MLPAQIIARFKGCELKGRTYKPMFPYFEEWKARTNGSSSTGAFRVLVDEYVTADAGTGVVHQAPAFGEDDYRVCLKAGEQGSRCTCVMAAAPAGVRRAPLAAVPPFPPHSLRAQSKLRCTSPACQAGLVHVTGLQPAFTLRPMPSARHLFTPPLRTHVSAGIIQAGQELPCPVDGSGRLTAQVTDFAGQ